MEMHELVKLLEKLDKKLVDLRGLLRLADKKKEIVLLHDEMNQANFWDNPEQATKKSKRLGYLEQEQTNWEDLSKKTADLLEMARLDEVNQDVNLREDLEKQTEIVNKAIEQLEFNTLLDGKYDDHNLIMSIHAGSGGTEAQDWTEMLARMYLRYFEKKGWQVHILEEMRGQEAGYKSITLRVAGDFAYGYLKSEHGTHRLVRISPFDAEKMRHTSFALVEIIPEMEDSESLEIDPKDLRIDTFMSGGHGGQSVNTTYSAVRIVHLPSNISVSCQNERSQQQNKENALRILRSKLQKIQDDKDEEEKQKLRGEYKSPEWGSQIRSYVLHPYHLVKDLRTDYETTDDVGVLDGDLDQFVETYLRWLKNK